MRAQPRSRSGQRGTTLLLFTLILPAFLIPMAGLAIDATVLRIVQGKLSAAVDGAAIGAGRLLGTTAVPETLVDEFLKANFKTDSTAGFWGANNLKTQVTYTPGITKRIDITATVDVPLLFARVFGQSFSTVAAAGSSTRTDSRVMLVIDRSGSMNGDDGTGTGTSVLTDAKNFGAGFTQKFTEGSDELGLVVFDGSGVVAYPANNPSWDPTTKSTSVGGPDRSFNDPLNTHNMVAQINAITSNNGQTGTADALWLAYIEIQKAHLKDLAADGVDYRLNSIVLLTDGLPQAVSIWPNNPSDNALKTTSGCANKIVPVTNPNPTPMLGWVAVSRPFSSSNPVGIYQLASRDPAAAHTSIWWMAGKNSSGGPGDEENLNPLTATGCADLQQPGNIGTATHDFNKIPSIDMWGNSMTGTAYTTASQFVDASGNIITNPVYDGSTVLDQSKPTKGYHWALSFWNSSDDSARRIRIDANKPNRVDSTTLKIAIYVIGYEGNGGVDQGLLRRIANDKLSTSYTDTQATGIYVPAANKTELQDAFNTIYTAILRLAK